MKLNSRSVNLRHLQDALAALSAAASAARLAAHNAPLSKTPPSSVEKDRDVLATAYRAAQVGATAYEIAGAAVLPLGWAHGKELHNPYGPRYSGRVV